MVGHFTARQLAAMRTASCRRSGGVGSSGLMGLRRRRGTGILPVIHGRDARATRDFNLPVIHGRDARGTRGFNLPMIHARDARATRGFILPVIHGRAARDRA